MLDARAVAHGALVGAARGEAFYCPGPLLVGGLPGLDEERASGPPVYRSYC